MTTHAFNPACPILALKDASESTLCTSKEHNENYDRVVVFPSEFLALDDFADREEAQQRVSPTTIDLSGESEKCGERSAESKSVCV